MNKDFSNAWISSKKPNKQRKYRFKAPLHVKGDFLNAHLSKELRTKHGVRALRLRVGDKVRIMRGKFKKQEAKVEEVDLKKTIVYLSKIEHVKRDGSKTRYPVTPSNLLLVELNLDDKKRLSKSPKDNQKDTKKNDQKNDQKDVQKDTKKNISKNTQKNKEAGKTK